MAITEWMGPLPYYIYIIYIYIYIHSYPLVMTNIAIENGHRNSGFTHEKW